MLLNWSEGQFNRFTDSTSRTASTYAESAQDVPEFEAGRLLIRRIRANIGARTSSFDLAPWSNANSATVTANAVVGPDGATTADQLNIASGATSRVVAQVNKLTTPAVVALDDNSSILCQCWLRADSPTTVRFNLRKKDASQAPSADIAVGTSWARYSAFFSDVGAGATAVQVGVENAAAGGAKTVFATQFSVFLAARYPLSDVVNTTGTAANSDSESGTGVSSQDVLLYFPQQVPLALREGVWTQEVVPQHGSADLVSGDRRLICGYEDGNDYLQLRHDGSGVKLEAVQGGVVRVASSALTYAADSVNVLKVDPAGSLIWNGVTYSGAVFPAPAGKFLRWAGIPGVYGNEFDGAFSQPIAA